MHRYYLDRYGADTIYIPNGIILPARKLKPQRISKWGLGERDYVLFVGRLEPEKGCHTLIAAFQSLISNSEVSLKLAIAGPKGYSKAYVKTLERNKSERILFLDYVRGETLEELYSNALAFVLPSSVEGMSNALLSAMAYGVPVVVSDIPENLALIEKAPYSTKLHDQPGLSFQLGNVSDLAGKIHLLVQDLQSAIERGTLLQSHVRENFNLEVMGHRTRELYTRLLGQIEPRPQAHQ
jgi:glycosyltransferase involved in cell wall biosynthesis